MKKSNYKKKRTILVFISLTIILLLSAISCNQQKTPGEEKAKSVEPTDIEAPAEEAADMDVLYIGINNSIKADLSEYEASEIEVLIDNGKIRLVEGKYVANPMNPGTAVITILSKGTEVDKMEYAVKVIADPAAIIGGKTGGEIDKDFLLEQEILSTNIEKPDYPVEFRIIAFSVSITEGENTLKESSDSDKITAKQKELIKNTDLGQAVVFSDIQCIGPDGRIRKLSPVTYILE